MSSSSNSPPSKTAVLVVNYNGRRFLAECFDALRAQSRRADLVVMVDNGSTDGSVDFVRQNYPEVVVLPEPENHGFAEGNNVGLRWIVEHHPVDFVALVNNDTRAEPQWLQRLEAALASDPTLGSAASCMLYAHDADKVNNAGDMPLWDGAGLARGRHACTGEFASDAEVFGACGGAALYRLEALKQAAMGRDFLDPDFFAYNEDLDLAWRLRRHGWRSRYVAQARILHHHSATGGRQTLWKMYHGERNRCWTLVKNFAWPLVLVSPVYTAVRMGVILAGGRRSGSTASGYLEKSSPVAIAGTLLKAWGAALLGVPRMLRKRWRFGLGFGTAEQWALLRKLGAPLSRTSSH